VLIKVDERYLPITLTASPMTDEKFDRFCNRYPDLFVEQMADGRIHLMAPNFPWNGLQNGEIAGQLVNWAQTDRRGLATDCTAGFHLPNGARLSADVAWTLKNRILELPDFSRGYWPFAPDFVVEVHSEMDRLRPLPLKMQEWIDNGAQLAWLIDPEREAVEIYRPGHAPEIRRGILSVAGEGPIEGFVLELRRVWHPLGESFTRNTKRSRKLLEPRL
jgi:Uma2 family endonuclease